MTVQYKVHLIDFWGNPDRDLNELQRLLDEGWIVSRCDASHPGGETSDKGKLVYILQKL